MQQLNVVTIITNAVKVLKSDDDFGCEETDHVLREHFPGLPLQEQEELPAGAEIGDQANVGLGLRRGNHKRKNSELCTNRESKDNDSEICIGTEIASGSWTWKVE